MPVHGELLKIAKCQAFTSLFLILPGLTLPPVPAQIPPFSTEFGRFRANLAHLTPAGKEASMWGKGGPDMAENLDTELDRIKTLGLGALRKH